MEIHSIVSLFSTQWAKHRVISYATQMPQAHGETVTLCETEIKKMQ